MSVFEDFKNKLSFLFKIYTLSYFFITVVLEISFSKKTWCIYLYQNCLRHIIAREHLVDILHRLELASHEVPEINMFLFLSFLFLYYAGFLYLCGIYFKILWFEGDGAYYTQKKLYFFSTLKKVHFLCLYVLYMFLSIVFFNVLRPSFYAPSQFSEECPALVELDDYYIPELRKFYTVISLRIEHHTPEIWPVHLVWDVPVPDFWWTSEFICCYPLLILMVPLFIFSLITFHQVSQTIALKRHLTLKKFTAKPLLAFLLDYFLAPLLVLLFYFLELVDFIYAWVPELEIPLIIVGAYLGHRLFLLVLHL